MLCGSNIVAGNLSPILLLKAMAVVMVSDFIFFLCLWVEHDPMEIIETVKVCIKEAVGRDVKHNMVTNLKAIGITNYRETMVL
jgi:glycerol kinase